MEWAILRWMAEMWWIDGREDSTARDVMWWIDRYTYIQVAVR